MKVIDFQKYKDKKASDKKASDRFFAGLKPGSEALFISTPRGRNNWFSRFYNRGFTDEFSEWGDEQ